MVRITETSTLSNYEKSKLKKEEDVLMVGKRDKTISVVSGGELIPIKEMPLANRTGSGTGFLSIPTIEGLPFEIQYGKVTLLPNTTVTVTFPKAFANQCFQVQITLVNNVADATTVRASSGTPTSFTITSANGTVDNIVQWMAIGF